jgi:hypothetical protein
VLAKSMSPLQVELPKKRPVAQEAPGGTA